MVESVRSVAGAARSLSGSVLGILALGLVLVEAVLVIVVVTGRVQPPDSHWLIGFVIVFPFFIFGVLVYVMKMNPLLLLIGMKNQNQLAKLITPNTIEPLPHKTEPWRDPSIYDADRLTGGSVTSTTIMTLFNSLQTTEPWDYVVVDIERGQRWLASRLFIFAILLRAILGLRCLIFVQTESGVNRRFIGAASPGEVRRALAAAYPWFEDSLKAATITTNASYFIDDLSASDAFPLMQGFVQSLQSFDEMPGDLDWAKLEGGNWEHSPWLDANLVRRIFAGAFFPQAGSTIRRENSRPDMELYAAIMKCAAPFAALVNAKGEFLELYDRQKIVSRVADQVYAAVRSAEPIAAG
jgi:hypothetical protein